MFSKGDKVITEFGTGTVINVRVDSNGVPLFTISLDDVCATPDGLLIARDCELQEM